MATKLSSHEEISMGFSKRCAVAKGMPRNSHAPVGDCSPVSVPRVVAIV